MPWGTVDDRFYDHDKVLDIPAAIRNEACGLYWRAISYCNAKLTDGVVTAAVVEHLDGREELVDALVAAELWHRKRGHKGRAGRGTLTSQSAPCFVIHDYHDFNKTRTQVEQQHASKAAAGRLGGFKSGEARRKQSPKQTRTKGEAGASGVVASSLNSESVTESIDTPPNPPRQRGGRRNGAGPMRSSTDYDALLISDDTPDDEIPDEFAGIFGSKEP